MGIVELNKEYKRVVDKSQCKILRRIPYPSLTASGSAILRVM